MKTAASWLDEMATDTLTIYKSGVIADCDERVRRIEVLAITLLDSQYT